jgi:hypothetical protein
MNILEEFRVTPEDAKCVSRVRVLQIFPKKEWQAKIVGEE